MAAQPENLRVDIPAVIAKLENPENWTKGSACKDKDGNTVGMFGPNKNKICKFCMYGAVIHNFNTLRLTNVPMTMNLIAEVIIERFPERINIPDIVFYQVTNFNDHESTTHDDVMSVLRECAKRAGCDKTLFSSAGIN